MKSTLVIYHNNCLDGFGAALAAWKYLEDSAEYLPANYGDAPPDVTGKHVYVLDFSYPRDVLLEMQEKAASIVVIDHHKTAQKNLEGLPFVIFDMRHSGAVLTWRYFFRSTTTPEILEIIEDRDLWRFRKPETKAICAALSAAEFSFETWNEFITHPHQSKMDLEAIGKILLNVFEQELQKLYEHKHKVAVGGYTLWACNVPRKYASELGNLLAKEHGVGMVYYYSGVTNTFNCSLRSTGNLDVAEIAETFGGGGHKNAAGFEIETLNWSI